MAHLIDELGDSRRLWHDCRDRAARFDEVEAARKDLESRLAQAERLLGPRPPDAGEATGGK